MVVVPNTEIRLLQVPLTLDLKNQITFQNSMLQYNYFNSHVVDILDGSSYQRKDNVIRYPDHIDNIINCNYVMYQNENYLNKWFYAFITNMRYVNDGMTEISIATDVFQTWQFDLIFKESFIEREMINVNEDIPGANLLPESLETGEYKIGGTAEIDDLEPWYIVAYAKDDDFGFKYNGIYSGIKFYAYSDVQALRGFLTQIALADPPGTQYILSIFTVPKLAFYPLPEIANEMNEDIKATPRPVTLSATPTSLDGYTPKNQKLRQYPFCYVGFNPQGGSSKIYRYEDFKNGTPIFNIISEINPNPQVAVIPQNYRGVSGDSLQDLSIITGYPTISWSVDAYNVWLAQNSNLINLKMDNLKTNTAISQAQKLGGIANSGLNLATGKSGILETVGNVGNQAIEFERSNINYEYAIKEQQAQIEVQQMLPDQGHFGSNNATLLGYELFDKNVFTRYTIKRQFAERIDQFFDMFGYQTNRVKIPNINNRPNWNYVKCINANILGNIPESDLLIIRNLFNSGITLWHNPDTFLDYSQNNR